MKTKAIRALAALFLILSVLFGGIVFSAAAASDEERVSDWAFGALNAYGETVEAILAVLGSPERHDVTKEDNLHIQGAVNDIHRLYYRDLEITVAEVAVKTEHEKSFVIHLMSRSPDFPASLKPGQRAEEAVALFGEPEERAEDSMKFETDFSSVAIRLENEKIVQIDVSVWLD